ncbi:NmrA/HSCARG family protein [Paraburkholderia sp. CNPSo 3274]|uniref:NmrA/HSCARG family protein n=1 Tax=Paraburkholderia sp. CNPSo 3274 TaxID=2940932 RepID=UPI0020B69005|nr:NmrA/HSCARG family protein [Paraburkholderia sp. CNPSo 3274]MCP3707043.1 NmrA/HSCARG family protein [Paraburkholderia sp. CNPSo 3274]
MTESSDVILVIGATGAQGGATARRLLAAGRTVRFLTRDPDSSAARALVELNAQGVRGDLDDRESLEKAMKGVRSVFSVLLPDFDRSDRERRQGFALVDAARNAGVQQFVHTSVAQAGNHLTFPGWNEKRWNQKYWTDKWDVEEAVRSAGFESWTVLQPAFMMDNLAEPKARAMFPHLRDGLLLSALLPDSRLDWIAADDVGALAAGALNDAQRWHGETVPLASEKLTMSEVGTRLGQVLGTQIGVSHVSPDEARAKGLAPGWVNAQEWINAVGYRVDIDSLSERGIELTSMTDWIDANRRHIKLV